MHPVATQVEGEAEGLGVGERAPADAVRGLEQGHAQAQLGRGLRGGEASRAGADDDHVDGRIGNAHGRAPLAAA